MNALNYQSPSAILIIKHQLSFKDSNLAIDRWLAKHPDQTRQTLSELLQLGKVFFKDDRIYDLPQLSADEAKLLVQEILQSPKLAIKDRSYHLKKYPQCFVGSELVDWLTENKGLVTEEAISIGQSLLEHNFIGHVSNDHAFKNDYLFYVFKETINLEQLLVDEARLLAHEILESKTLEIKDRRYHLKKYPECFIGSELVDWLTENKHIAKPKAISIGQSLLEHNFIEHVSNDHAFKNDFLFYRFQNL